MSRPDKQAYDPSDADKRDLIGLIRQGWPLLGKSCVITGGMVSTRLYCHVAPGPVALKAFAGEEKSVMP